MPAIQLDIAGLMSPDAVQTMSAGTLVLMHVSWPRGDTKLDSRMKSLEVCVRDSLRRHTFDLPYGRWAPCTAWTSWKLSLIGYEEKFASIRGKRNATEFRFDQELLPLPLPSGRALAELADNRRARALHVTDLNTFEQDVARAAAHRHDTASQLLMLTQAQLRERTAAGVDKALASLGDSRFFNGRHVNQCRRLVTDMLLLDFLPLEGMNDAAAAVTGAVTDPERSADRMREALCALRQA